MVKPHRFQWLWLVSPHGISLVQLHVIFLKVVQHNQNIVAPKSLPLQQLALERYLIAYRLCSCIVLQKQLLIFLDKLEFSEELIN